MSISRCCLLEEATKENAKAFRIRQCNVNPFTPRYFGGTLTTLLNTCWRWQFSQRGLGMCEPNDFYLIWEFLHFGLTEKELFQVILGLLLVYADWEKGGLCLRVCMCVCFMTENCWDMFFVVRSNDSFNFALGWIKYIVIVVIVTFPNRSVEPDVPETESQKEWCRLFSLKKEGRDWGPRRGRPRRMPETDVPETYGTDLCPWDVWYRPVSMRRMVQNCVL